MPDPTNTPTPTTSPTMNNHRRATPENWAVVESWGYRCDTTSCILELRARVEALEAAANNRQHGEAAERAEPGPAASLVDRVANAIYNVPADSEAKARAAIREVAAWINERELKVYNDPGRGELESPTADEAIGWLRDEIAPHA